MQKKIEDYIHFYFGCEVQTTARKEASSGERMGYKTGKMIDMDIRCKQSAIEVDGVPIDFDWTEIKPILRQTLSITAEEKIHVAQLVLYRYAKHFQYPVLLRIKENGSVYVYNDADAVVGMVTIETDGISYSGGLTATDRSFFTPNQYEATAYLLKQGFDLFGLIEAGLAIDKTKI